MNDKTIRRNLVVLRNAKRLTQEEVARSLGISRQAYINLEKGKTHLVSKTLVKMEELFGVPAEKIIFGTSHEEMKETLLRERNTLRMRVEEAEKMHARERDAICEKMNILSRLENSERLHLLTQKNYIADLERQLQDSRKEADMLRKECRILRNLQTNLMKGLARDSSENPVPQEIDRVL